MHPIDSILEWISPYCFFLLSAYCVQGALFPGSFLMATLWGGDDPLLIYMRNLRFSQLKAFAQITGWNVIGQGSQWGHSLSKCIRILKPADMGHYAIGIVVRFHYLFLWRFSSLSWSASSLIFSVFLFTTVLLFHVWNGSRPVRKKRQIFRLRSPRTKHIYFFSGSLSLVNVRQSCETVRILVRGFASP